MTEPATIHAGELFTVETGEYSDFQVHGIFRALRDFEPSELLKGRKFGWTSSEPELARKFMAELVMDKTIEPVDCRTLSLESYGLFADNLTLHAYVGALTFEPEPDE